MCEANYAEFIAMFVLVLCSQKTPLRKMSQMTPLQLAISSLATFICDVSPQQFGIKAATVLHLFLLHRSHDFCPIAGLITIRNVAFMVESSAIQGSRLPSTGRSLLLGYLRSLGYSRYTTDRSSDRVNSRFNSLLPMKILDN